jgi:hypothetical protein
MSDLAIAAAAIDRTLRRHGRHLLQSMYPARRMIIAGA